jgi:hypothetical protein
MWPGRLVLWLVIGLAWAAAILIVLGFFLGWGDSEDSARKKLEANYARCVDQAASFRNASSRFWTR